MNPSFRHFTLLLAAISAMYPPQTLYSSPDQSPQIRFTCRSTENPTCPPISSHFTLPSTVSHNQYKNGSGCIPLQKTYNNVRVFTIKELSDPSLKISDPEFNIMYYWGQSEWHEYFDHVGVKTAYQACGFYQFFQYSFYPSFLQKEFGYKSSDYAPTDYEKAIIAHCNILENNPDLCAAIDWEMQGSIVTGILAQGSDAQKQINFKSSYKTIEIQTKSCVIQNGITTKRAHEIYSQSMATAQRLPEWQKTTNLAERSHLFQQALKTTCRSDAEYRAYHEYWQLAGRKYALDKTFDNKLCVRVEQYDRATSEQVAELLHDAGVENTFTKCIGTDIQQHTHTECVLLLDDLASTYQTAKLDTDLREGVLQTTRLLAKAQECIKSCLMQSAFALIDAARCLGNYTIAITKGAGKGVWNSTSLAAKGLICTTKLAADLINSEEARKKTGNELVAGAQWLKLVTKGLIKYAMATAAEDCNNDMFLARPAERLAQQSNLPLDQQFPVCAMITRGLDHIGLIMADKSGLERAEALSELVASAYMDNIIFSSTLKLAGNAYAAMAQDMHLAGQMLAYSELGQRATHLHDCAKSILQGALESSAAHKAVTNAGEIFARMSPTQLRELGKSLQEAVHKATQAGAQEARFSEAAGEAAKLTSSTTAEAKAVSAEVTAAPESAKSAETAKAVEGQAAEGFKPAEVAKAEAATTETVVRQFWEKVEKLGEVYGKENVAEAIDVLKVTEQRIVKHGTLSKIVEDVSVDLKKINSNDRWRMFKYEARNPKNKVTLKSIEEAMAGITCEEHGLLKQLERSTHEAEEFVDAFNQKWDVKSAPTHSIYGQYVFDIDGVVSALKDGFSGTENVILTLRKTHASDLEKLFAEIRLHVTPEDLHRMVIVNANNPNMSMAGSKLINFFKR